jgi:hypothetical protein
LQALRQPEEEMTKIPFPKLPNDVLQMAHLQAAPKQYQRDFQNFAACAVASLAEAVGSAIGIGGALSLISRMIWGWMDIAWKGAWMLIAPLVIFIIGIPVFFFLTKEYMQNDHWTPGEVFGFLTKVWFSVMGIFIGLFVYTLI